MLKTILTWGLIAGLIMMGVFFLVIMKKDFSEMDFDSGQFIGYASMILAFGAGFFGVRQLRDKSKAKWGFLKAWGAGLGIVLVGGMIYSAGWVYYAENNPEQVEAMMDMYAKSIQDNPELTDAQKEAQLQEMESFSALYDNPLSNFLVTLLIEPLPPGIIISLIIAIILRKPSVNQHNDQLLDENIASA
ncbi:DUF4199 domain-containing protein [Phaeocystidibacter luteus]|nr:DUF4199 domain-containing protein [Phaeocystidibacter luteus]